MNKILCPIDFSNASLNAIEYAVEIGKKFHSTITLLNVFTESDFNKVLDTQNLNKSLKERIELASERLKSLTDEVNADYAQDNIQCEYSLEMGDLIDGILLHQAENDLIVMGTTGISKTNGVFFGSNTEEILDKSGIPVLCVPEEASYNGFDKIVYASDFLKEDRVIIQKVISFATIFDARIHVLHINTHEAHEEYSKFVDELKSFIQYQKINFTYKTYDDVGQGIESYMSGHDIDLLTVYKRERNFVSSIFHKSLTKTLSYSTDKPLLVFKYKS